MTDTSKSGSGFSKEMPNAVASAFGQAVRDARTESGLSQRDLSRTSKVSYSYLNRIERGEQVPSYKASEAIAQALGITQADLHTRARDVGSSSDMTFVTSIEEDNSPFLLSADSPPSINNISLASSGMSSFAGFSANDASLTPDMDAFYQLDSRTSPSRRIGASPSSTPSASSPVRRARMLSASKSFSGGAPDRFSGRTPGDARDRIASDASTPSSPASPSSPSASSNRAALYAEALQALGRLNDDQLRRSVKGMRAMLARPSDTTSDE